MNKIISIEETTEDFTFVPKEEKEYSEGYKVTTEDSTYYILIDQKPYSI